MGKYLGSLSPLLSRNYMLDHQDLIAASVCTWPLDKMLSSSYVTTYS